MHGINSFYLYRTAGKMKFELINEIEVKMGSSAIKGVYFSADQAFFFQNFCTIEQEKL